MRDFNGLVSKTEQTTPGIASHRPLRHKDPLLCTQGALAQLLFWLWHVAGEPAPSFRRRQDWYRIKVLVGQDREGVSLELLA